VEVVIPLVRRLRDNHLIFPLCQHERECAVQGQSTQPVKVRSREVSVHLGSYPGDGEGDRPVEASGTEIRLGRVSERTGRNASEA
jgi:hypothetical protein